MILRSNDDAHTLEPHKESAHWSQIMRNLAACCQQNICLGKCCLFAQPNSRFSRKVRYMGRRGTPSLTDTSPTGARVKKTNRDNKHGP